MAAKLHIVTLSKEERVQLGRAARSDKNSARERLRARILLLADTASPEGALKDSAIVKRTGACEQTVQQLRKRFALQGLKRATCHGEQKRRKARKLDGRAEAHLVALTCAAPPQGRKRWSLHLLAGRLIETGFVDSVSHESVRQTLKKKISSSP